MKYEKIGTIAVPSKTLIFGDMCYFWGQDNETDDNIIGKLDEMVSDENMSENGYIETHDSVIVEIDTNFVNVHMAYSDQDGFHADDRRHRPAIVIVSLVDDELPPIQDFKDTGVCLGVDAGVIYVGDLQAMAGNVIQDDLAGGWGEVCEKHFDRSGYNKCEHESWNIPSFRAEYISGFLEIYEEETNEKEKEKIAKSIVAKVCYHAFKIQQMLEEMGLEIPEIVNQFCNDENTFGQFPMDIVTIGKFVEFASELTATKREEIWSELKGYSPFYWNDGAVCGFETMTNYGDGGYPFMVYEKDGIVTHYAFITLHPTSMVDDDEDDW